MHPSLGIQQFAQLPLSLRKIAKAAADASVPDVTKLFQLTASNHPQSHLFIPAFYACLDTAKMPTPDEMDLVTHTNYTTIQTQSTALQALLIAAPSNIRSEAFPDLWRRVWPWIQFLHTYGQSIRIAPANNTATILVLLLRCFLDHSTSAQLIDSTPGVRATISHCWKTFLRRSGEHDPALPQVCSFVARDYRSFSNVYLDEYIEGAGGSAEDLAVLVMRHLKHVTDVTTAPQRFLLSSILAFASRIDGSLDTDNRLAFHATLLSSGIVKLVLKIWRTAITFADDQLQGACCGLLGREFSTSEGYPHLEQALKAGLLPVIASAAIHAPRTASSSMFEFCLDCVLPGATVRLSSLLQMEKSLPEVPPAREAGRPNRWNTFAELAHERIKFMRGFQSLTDASWQACGNISCGKRIERAALQTCSVCKSEYYCSRVCQHSDWKEGGHRERCKREPKIEADRLRSTAFMRELLNHDYAENKYEILLQQWRFIKAWPNKQFFTMFDYTEGRPKISVAVVDPHMSGSSERSVRLWMESSRRAARSAGRMELHLMVVQAGPEANHDMFPMRSANSRVHDQLRRLAKKMGGHEEPSPEVSEELRLLTILDVGASH
ncbi:hypothetical protein B0H10DRAFT_2047006 [Mycena sp. CBHHK59/15]|nr:hypothetical protein B0H10DRAFT_2047006 [Mycena sp. CBHHK59/15]